jgi:hypothetical protein
MAQALATKAEDQNSSRADSDRRYDSAALVEFVSSSVEQARAVEKPFFHLEFDRVFPDEIYKQILRAMPSAADYRPMSGRSKSYDAKPTRVKIDLFPEFIRHLQPSQKEIWRLVGRTLCSRPVKEAFVRKLGPGLSRRFGASYPKVGMYPIPILTRDITGYSIPPHTDTHWKGITVQLYLPSDESTPQVGTIFHEKLADGSMPKRAQMRFAPNTGYAFAVGDNTWHSADTVGPEVKSRDSILLTYFVDSLPLRFLRNRAKRVGNFFLNEARYLKAIAK